MMKTWLFKHLLIWTMTIGRKTSFRSYNPVDPSNPAVEKIKKKTKRKVILRLLIAHNQNIQPQ